MYEQKIRAVINFYYFIYRHILSHVNRHRAGLSIPFFDTDMMSFYWSHWGFCCSAVYFLASDAL